MDSVFFERGFLPAHDPAPAFPAGSSLSVLDDIGRDLPSLVEDAHFREYARELAIPEWPDREVREDTLPYLRLYYVRVGFLASAYINHVGQARATTMPSSLAIPLSGVTRLLRR